MQWEVTFRFCKTRLLKLFHECIVGKHLILMEQNLGKFHANLKLLIFLCFSYNFVMEYKPTITTENLTKSSRNPNIIIDKPPKNSDRDRLGSN